MNRRIQKWMQEKGLNSSGFADHIGVNRATISHILSGRNKPSIDFLEKMIKAFPDMNLNWVLSGEGFMYKSKEGQVLKQSSGCIKKIVVFYDDNSFEELKP